MSCPCNGNKQAICILSENFGKCSHQPFESVDCKSTERKPLSKLKELMVTLTLGFGIWILGFGSYFIIPSKSIVYRNFHSPVNAFPFVAVVRGNGFEFSETF
jgi:hypothetical protein